LEEKEVPERMKRPPRAKWSTRSLEMLAVMFEQVNAQPGASADEAMTSAPEALRWAAKRIDDLERRLAAKAQNQNTPASPRKGR
jgi:hypothetical protein